MSSPIKRTPAKADVPDSTSDVTETVDTVKGTASDFVVVRALKDGVSVAGTVLKAGEEARVLRSKTLDRDGKSWLDMNQNDYFGEKRFEIVK